MPRTKQNPETGMLLLLGGGAVVAYGIYAGWFNSLFGTTPTVVVTPQAPAATSTGNPISSGAAVVNTPTTPPPLGTVVQTAADTSAQITANYPYIIPSPTMINTLGALAAQAGYSAFSTSDMGTVYVRKDIAAAVNTDINNRVQRATQAGAASTSIANASNETFGQIQQLMTTQGLSGLGFARRAWGYR